MRKADIMRENKYCETLFTEYWKIAFPNGVSYHYENEERLDYCSATTFEMGGYVWLRSYSTIIAVYNPVTNELFDMLRYVYGYTATSAKHVAKFRNSINLSRRVHNQLGVIEHRYYSL